MKWCDVAVEEALHNWSRWACGHAGGPINRISSLEGRYIPEPLEDEEPVQRTYNPINETSAVRMEKVVRSLEPRHKKLVKHHYIYRSDPKHACRRLRISIAAWHLEMMSAHSRISLAFNSDSQ